MARALAILGMFVVHAGLVLARADERGLASLAFDACDGRAAATFLVIASIGTGQLAAARGTGDFRRRGLLLLVLGFLNLAVWPGDILRVYGCAFLAAPLLVRASARALVVTTLVLFAAFVPFLLWGDWDARWSWDDLHYRGLWTPLGLARNLALDGFRPLVPWLGFFTLGVALSRRPALELRRLALPGAALAVSAALASFALVALGGREASEDERQVIVALVGTASMPPMPLFLATAVGTALAVIGASIALADVAPRLVAPLAATGRLAGTWYLAHITALVLAFLAGVKTTGPFALALAAGAFALVVALSVAARGRPGPFEWLLRRVTR